MGVGGWGPFPHVNFHVEVVIIKIVVAVELNFAVSVQWLLNLTSTVKKQRNKEQKSYKVKKKNPKHLQILSC